MFSLCLNFQGYINPLGPSLASIEVDMRMFQVRPWLRDFYLDNHIKLQIFYLAFALFVFALALTFVARKRPHGPQPAAYGHLQTLANLVDEWSPTMWWGHKKDGMPVSHAGGLAKSMSKGQSLIQL